MQTFPNGIGLEKSQYPKTKPILLPEGAARYVKVTKNNVGKLADWSGGKATYITKKVDGGFVIADRLKLRTRKGNRVANIGDIITRRVFPHPKTGMRTVEFTVIKAEDFAKFVLV